MRTVLSALALPALLLSGCASTGAPGEVVGGGPYLYAAGQDDAVVSVIDIPTLQIVETVELQALGFSENARPHHVVVEPDGSHWYVSLIGDNAVLRFDRENRLVGRADFQVPGLLALHPTEDVLYVGRSMAAVNPPRRIGRIDRSTMEVDEIDVFIPRPHAVAMSPGGALVYTASLAEDRMVVVRPDEEDIELLDLPSRHGGGHPVTLVQFAVSPDGTRLVGTGEMTHELLVFDITDPAAPEHVTSVDVGARPWHPIFTPDGGRLFFANKGADEVTVVDTDDWSVLARISGGFDAPHGSAISPDGTVVFISSNGTGGAPGSVTAIDTGTLRVLKTIPLGRNVTGLGAPSGS